MVNEQWVPIVSIIRSFTRKKKANHQNYIEHLVSYLAFLTSMIAVFHIVFEMTSFFIIFADHVIIYHCQYLCPLHGSHDSRVGVATSTLPKS